MGGWATHQGRAVHLPLDNVDTDQIIPARFMSAPRSEGYGRFLLHDMRRDGDGALRSDFPLNAVEDASLLIAGANFGSGSSREAAVYALVDAGFRAVIAPGFGDIFAGNAVNNGLLPAVVTREDLTKIAAEPTLTIAIEDRSITAGDTTIRFELPDTWATKLINGWDDIDLTLQHADAIASFRETRDPWTWPAT